MSGDAYREANRKAWNQTAPYHRADPQYARLLAGFRDPAFSCLDAVATELLQGIGVAGRDVAQLCCNNGRELISVARLGAARCVGFDAAGAFLEQARELAAVAGADCEFVETDIYAVPAAYDGGFEVAYITVGVLGWMPDLAGFFRVAQRLLRPGGRFFAYEQHPILDMFEPERDGDPDTPVVSYFETKPLGEAASLDYFGNAQYAAETSYWFMHPLGDVVTACLEQGFVLEHLREYPHNVSSDNFAIYENRDAQFPLSYSLIARKLA